MAEKNSINYCEIKTPFVLRSDGLNSWPSYGWTLKDWCEKCKDIPFPFRVHKKNSSNYWETQSIDSFKTSLYNYEEWLQSDVNQCKDENPFKKYSKNDFWVYSSYNYMDSLFGDSTEIIESVKWSQLGLDSKLGSNAKNSTFWVGSEGAFTPCHQDSYGYNFVAQLSGKKLWVLFPPSDSTGLYPTRIPYEESSVFSSVDFRNPDYQLHPLFKHTNPHIIELSAGDILFVPHLWWHFVKVIEEDLEKSCISINTWIFNDCFESSLNESIVRFLTTALFNTYQPLQPSNPWLNTNADLFSAEESVHSLGLVLKQINSMKGKTETNDSKDTVLPQNYRSIDSSDFIELRKYFNENHNKKFKSDQQMGDKNVKIESIVNCVLDPDVIELIAQKLKNISLKI